MIRRVAQGVAYYQFESLALHAGVRHAIFTRLGGVSQGAFAGLNVGSLVGDAPAAVEANHVALFQAFGVRPGRVVTARQVHGDHVAVAGAAEGGTTLPATDALITREPGTALLLRFADCLPLLLCDLQHSAIGLVHAGWRGVVAGVVPRAVTALQQNFGCHPSDLWAGLGPCIRVCCYEVGSELAEPVRQAFGVCDDLLLEQAGGKWRFDLPAAVRRQLLAAGVQRIEDSGLCTSCRTDEFYSHRAENGQTGRFAVLLALLGGAHANP